MSDSKLTPLNWKNPIVHDDGTPTAYFIQLMQTLLEEKEATEDNLADFSIDELSDVDTVSTPPTDGQGLVWDDGLQQWVPGTVASSGGQVAFQGCLVKKSADQTAANYSTAAAVTWDVDVYDTNGFHSTTSNTSRITIPAGVTKVRLGYQMYLTAHVANEYVASYITKNGSSTWTGWASTYQETPLTTVSGVAWTPVVNVSEGDYFEVFLDTQSDTSITVEEEFNWFACEVIQSNSVFESTFQGALVKKSVDQTAANYTTATVLTFDTDVYDTLGFHDTSSNTSRLTVPSGVTKVRLSGQVGVSSSTANERITLDVLKNGAVFSPGYPVQTAETAATTRFANLSSAIIDVSAGDYFELRLTQTTDASITIEEEQTWFCIEVIGNSQAALATNFAGCLVTKAADQTGANYTTATAITWDSEGYDTHGFHSTSANTSRITIPAGVTKVRFQGCVTVTNNTADQFAFLEIQKNGSVSYLGYTTHNTEVGSTTIRNHITSPVLNVSAGDYFELFLQVEADITVDVLANRSWFACEVIEYTTPRTTAFGGARVRKAADLTGQNLTAGAVITWDTEDFDTHGFHDTSSNTSRITIPSGITKVMLTAALRINNIAASSVPRAFLTKNGTTTVVQISGHNPSTSWGCNINSGPLAVSAGDYFEISFQNDTDTSVDITAVTSWFAVEVLEGV